MNLCEDSRQSPNQNARLVPAAFPRRLGAIYRSGNRLRPFHRRAQPKAFRRLRDIGRAPAFWTGSEAISSPQQEYYRGRAVEERDAAAGSADPDVAELHGRMARLFESLANEMDRPRPAIAPGW